MTAMDIDQMPVASESVALIVQIGGHPGKQYDVKG
jgi:hypothetical protein